uniref:Neurotensin/neuromedin N n=1 Tax=Gasterosteus aculeatus aculeatus TaxID=481459 RepID=A0AAQ4RR34_GASAC|nr:neurotensin/neuromedin N [Gasterosteus aculeatus aculeatus]
MQAQLACMLLLCFTCGGLCTDVDRDPQALEEELVRSLFPSKAKQNKQSAPYWRVSLVDLCRMLNGVREEAWSSEEEGEEEGELREGSLHLREELYNLQVLCRALQSWEERILRGPQDYLEGNRDNPLKRKSPYILKRQAAHTTKSRRPYILKRSTTY